MLSKADRPYVRSRRRWLVPLMRRARVVPDGPAPSLPHKGRAMPQRSKVFVGLDTSKLKISIALAEEGRQGEVRFLGEIDNTPEAVRRLVSKLASRHSEVLFCYEAGPTRYGFQRPIAGPRHEGVVLPPPFVPKHPRERGKNNPPDAL